MPRLDCVRPDHRHGDTQSILARFCRRAPTPPEVLEQRERERELKELDRDTRTVFAYNLNLKADEKDLFDFFSRAGQVRLSGAALKLPVIRDVMRKCQPLFFIGLMANERDAFHSFSCVM